MGSTDSCFALVLIGIIAISCVSLFIVNFANAQSTPRPSAPEYNVKVNLSSLEMTIKNQPITTYVDANSSNPSLYYMFRFKDHENFQDWNYAPMYYVLPSTYGTYYKASTSDYTTLSFPIGTYPLTGILNSGQVDVQVMALIGNEVPTNYENETVYGFNGITSVWSNIQTITIPTSSISTTPNQTSSPTSTPYLPPRNPPHLEPIDYLLPIIVISAVITIIIVSVLRYRHKKITVN
jgi:hypothetical protein